jgi:hypothetical protein
MHRSGGASASSGPEITDLNRAVSFNDGDGEGYTSRQKKGEDSELHIDLIARYLIYYEMWILMKGSERKDVLLYLSRITHISLHSSIDGLKYPNLIETLQHT